MLHRGRDKGNSAISLPMHNIETKNMNEKNLMTPKARSQYKVKIYWRHILLLSCLWLFVIHYYERVVVRRAMKKCDWRRWEDWPEGSEPHRTALLADPQIMDAHSYPGRPWIVNYFTQQILDNYHKRNWQYMQYYLDPDSNFFLGDLFDGGRRWKDEDWIQEYNRFNKIFPKKPNRRTVMSLPGNHDIGFGDTVVESSAKRFSAYFGETSSKWDVGNHTFVLLDTISLSDTVNVNVSSIPREFLDRFSVQANSPRILLTHVPLWRDPQQQLCGDLRESNKYFPIMRGEQYQTVIDEQISQEVLSKIQPEIVFSGDDHDYCHVIHPYNVDGQSSSAEEITAKSCAMNMGIQRPAIQLLSLYNPQLPSGNGDTKTYKTNICYMPEPFKPIIVYVSTLVFTLCLIFWMCFFPSSFNVLVVRMGLKIMNTNKKTTLLPVSTKKSDEYTNSQKEVLRKYHVSETRNFYSFLVNGLAVVSIIFLIFAYHYKAF